MVSFYLTSDPLVFQSKIEKMRNLKVQMQKIKAMAKQKEDMAKKFDTYKQLIEFNKRREGARVQQQLLCQPLVFDTRKQTSGSKHFSVPQESAQLTKNPVFKKCFDDSCSVTSEPEHRQHVTHSIFETAASVHMSSTCSVSSLETRDATKIAVPFAVFNPSDCLASLEFRDESSAEQTRFSFLGKRALQICTSSQQTLVQDHEIITSLL